MESEIAFWFNLSLFGVFVIMVLAIADSILPIEIKPKGTTLNGRILGNLGMGLMGAGTGKIMGMIIVFTIRYLLDLASL